MADNRILGDHGMVSRHRNKDLRGEGGVAALRPLRWQLTCDFLSMSVAGNEDDIPLGSRDIVAF